MLSSIAPSNQGTTRFTCSRRASIPSVPSTTRATSPSQSARTVSPSQAAIAMSSARATPVAV
jgi:hypothetical protein